jgi:TIR domain
VSDIFISYKREEQATARKLADALESEGWTVWWDPELRAGEHFDEVIEKALNEAKCVIVMWSKRAVQSRYIKAEATYALDYGKLVPVAIEDVTLPFRFRGVHTLSLHGWDGSKDFSEYRRLVEDIAAIGALSPSEGEKGYLSDIQHFKSDRVPQKPETKFKPGMLFVIR